MEEAQQDRAERREAWVFTHPNQWTRTEAPVWPDGVDVDVYMAGLGYVPHSRARNSELVDFVGSWMLYTAKAPDAPYTHALLVDGAHEGCVLVWVPTLPDLLAYMATYGQVGQRDWEREEWDELLRAVQLAFRAWHGHSSDTFCRECDPAQYQRWQRAQDARRQRQAAP